MQSNKHIYGNLYFDNSTSSTRRLNATTIKGNNSLFCYERDNRLHFTCLHHSFCLLFFFYLLFFTIYQFWRFHLDDPLCARHRQAYVKCLFAELFLSLHISLIEKILTTNKVLKLLDNYVWRERQISLSLVIFQFCNSRNCDVYYIEMSIKNCRYPSWNRGFNEIKLLYTKQQNLRKQLSLQWIFNKYMFNCVSINWCVSTFI